MDVYQIRTREGIRLFDMVRDENNNVFVFCKRGGSSIKLPTELFLSSLFLLTLNVRTSESEVFMLGNTYRVFDIYRYDDTNVTIRVKSGSGISEQPIAYLLEDIYEVLDKTKKIA